MSEPTSYVVTDSYGSGYQGVVGIGVSFRTGRIICGDIAEAPDLLTGELLAILRAVEIATSITWKRTVIGTGHEPAAAMVRDPIWSPNSSIAMEIQELLAAHPRISVEHVFDDLIKPARIVARQVFKAWKCSFEDGVTWRPMAEEAMV